MHPSVKGIKTSLKEDDLTQSLTLNKKQITRFTRTLNQMVRHKEKMIETDLHISNPIYWTKNKTTMANMLRKYIFIK